MSDTPDIAKVVSMIMNNPKLIEEISAMAKSEGLTEGESTEENAEETVEESAPASAAPTYLPPPPPPPPKRRDRAVLLDALRPYLSKERQHAVDTMMTLADVFDAARRKP